MAMNKAEKAALELAQNELAVAYALRWSDLKRIEPDVPPPKTGSSLDALSVGWTYNSYSGCVMPACSSSIDHAIGRAGDKTPPKKTTSQHAISLYSTEVLALKALRQAMEHKFATSLAAVDRLIAEAEKTTASQGTKEQG